jgi:hypothetical protein
MPLQLDPYGSLFVVFREPAGRVLRKLRVPAQEAASRYGRKKISMFLQAGMNGNFVLHSNKGKTTEISVKDLPAPLMISGSWQVKFPEGWGAPAQADFDKLISWHTHMEKGIKYFSGTASYHKEIDIPAEMLSENYQISIDLGRLMIWRK